MKGTLTYAVTKGSSKYISVSKNGIVTLRKGCKKGFYKIRITAQKQKMENLDKQQKLLHLK